MSSTQTIQREYSSVHIGSVGELSDGRIGRQFTAALADAIGRVQDEETRRDKDGYAVAEVTIKLRVGGKPLGDGDMIDLSAEVSARLPGYRAASEVLQPIGGEYCFDTTPKAQQGLFTVPNRKES